MAQLIDARAKQDAAMLRSTAAQFRRFAISNPDQAATCQRKAAEMEARAKRVGVTVERIAA
jgi:hypothetical protein